MKITQETIIRSDPETRRQLYLHAAQSVSGDAEDRLHRSSGGSRDRPVPGRVSRQRGIGVADDQPPAVGSRKRKLSLAYPQPTVRQIIELANLHKTIPMIDAGVSSLAKKSA
jgi:hypothetical protein